MVCMRKRGNVAMLHPHPQGYAVWKILVEFFSCKKEWDQYFPVWPEQASSIKILLLWLYFEFPVSITLLYRRNVRATKTKTFLLFGFCYAIFAEVLPKCLARQQGKSFFLTAECFLLNVSSRTQISEISSCVVHLSSPYSKIWTAQETNQNAPFHGLDQFGHIIKFCLTLPKIFFKSFEDFQGISDDVSIADRLRS